MQKYTEITADTSLENSRAQLLANDKTIASHYAGDAFPAENLVVGMECYRTDEHKKYRLSSLEPVAWEIVPGAVDLPIKAGKNIKVTKNAATKAVTVAVNGTVESAKYANAAGYLAQNAIASGADLNDLREEGGYICASDEIAATLANCPTDEAFGLSVENTGVGVVQILKQYSVAQPGILFRTACEGAWSAWNGIPVYNADGHLVLPNGAEFWLE